MASSFSYACLLVVMLMPSLMAVSADFNDCNFYWGPQLANIQDGGESLTMSLVNASGCAFQSYGAYFYGRFDIFMKLVPGDSSGTVTTYYLSNQGQYHDEIDFEFLGNVSGQPYILHTNVFAKGQGSREQQFYLDFDPTADYHKYSIIWNPQLIMWLVDDSPIRVYSNKEDIGVPFPNTQAMNIYSSIWCGETWATQGGAIKTNWAYAPFTASYKDLGVSSCGQDSSGTSPCSGSSTAPAWLTQQLDASLQAQLLSGQKCNMIYNYCTDYQRFPQQFPPECY